MAPLFGLTVLLAAVAAVVFWVSDQSRHVQSRNAVVRGQLTEVGTRLSGVLTSAEVREGEQVRAGQVLARLDDRHLLTEEVEAAARIEVLKRELDLERALIGQERTRLGQQRQESAARADAAEAEVTTARIRAEDARQAHRALASLVGNGAIAIEEVREAEARYRAAEAQMDAARANAAAVHTGAKHARQMASSTAVRDQKLALLQSHVVAAEAQLARVRADLEGAVVRAPADGTVSRWLIKPGGSVEVGKPVLSMSLGRDVWVEAWVDEEDIHRVQPGQAVLVTLPSHAGRELVGKVEAIGITTDFEEPVDSVPQPRAVRMRGAPMVSVRVLLDDPPVTLRPGLSAAVAISGDAR
jgi:multidrug resistance efflux pump